MAKEGLGGDNNGISGGCENKYQGSWKEEEVSGVGGQWARRN